MITLMIYQSMVYYEEKSLKMCATIFSLWIGIVLSLRFKFWHQQLFFSSQSTVMHVNILGEST